MDFKKQGRRNKARGAAFERRVRADLESKDWFVAKFSNNVDLTLMKMVPAKSNRFFMRQTGFPDFIVFKPTPVSEHVYVEGYYEVNGVEVKSDGYLDKGEKARVKFLLENKIFSEIEIAKKGKKRGEIVYELAKTT